MKRSMKPGTMLYPLPAVLVTGGDMEHSTVMTAAWTGIVNSDPPMTYVSIRPERCSYGIIRERGEFVINLTTADMAKDVDYAGCVSGRKEDKFEKLGFVKERGEIVICDRFVDSSIAYQAYGRCLGDMVAEVNKYATGGLRPDLTIWLDIDPETGKARASGDKGPDRLDLESSDFHERVREGYKVISESEPERFKRIDATGSIEEIKEKIYSCLEELCIERCI